MPRNMSFALTTEQFKARIKDLTRRLGWWFLREGDLVMGVEKGMGLGKGGKVKRLGLIRIKSVRREPLNAITADDVAREGYPGKSTECFIAKFCKAMKCEPGVKVNRIEYEYVRLTHNAFTGEPKIWVLEAPRYAFPKTPAANAVRHSKGSAP